MKRSCLVCGPESSGTRLMTQILIAAGCDGDGGHGQRWDTRDPGSDVIVWRRSFPHAQQWPSIPKMADRMRGLGYEVTVVVTTRDWYPMCRSQVKAGHVGNVEQALENLQMAYPLIFGGIAMAKVDFVVVSYEGLVQRKRAYLERLMPLLGLPTPEVELYDANSKWYGEG